MLVLTPELREKAEEIKARYPDGRERSAMLPLLYLVQSVEGHVSRDGLREVAGLLGTTTAEVEAVASFYTMLRLRPTGTHLVNVCTNLSCALRGAKAVHEAAHRATGIPRGGELSEDGSFSVHEEECLGACDAAPVVQIDFANHDRVTPERMAELIERIRAGEVPEPARGRAPEDLKHASRILAGLEDDLAGIDDPGSGDTDRGAGGGLRARPRATEGWDVMPSGGPPTNKILTANWGNPDVIPIGGYQAAGGYEGLRTALGMTSSELIDLMKASGLRGRGGAGFPAGVKWSFVPQATGKPTYVVANFDESEPGTFNNRELVEREPHQLLEGVAIAAYGIGSHEAYIYCRGEFLHQGQVLSRAIREAYAEGVFGDSVLGSGYELNVILHRGAGAYICGEETALLSSLEGYRGQPRLRPPFPAVEGLYGCPTLINNVETLCSVPHILRNGAEWFAKIGPEKSPGTKVFSVSGKVERPGNYELPMGTPLRTLLDEHAGGVLGGRRLKAWTPGGSSTSMLTDEHLDVALDFESVAAAGSLLGTGAVIVMDETDCIVEATRRLVAFYAHESCGKCTPCREGTWWGTRVLERIEAGFGRPEDLPLLDDLGRNILFRAFCALADGAVSPIQSSLKYFRDEYERHIEERRCPFSGEGPGVTTPAEPVTESGLTEVLG